MCHHGTHVFSIKKKYDHTFVRTLVITVLTFQMLWKFLYSKSSGDHGTLDFFRSHLRRASVTANPKKDVNACVDLIYTVTKGHILACACDILNISGLDEHPAIPPGLKEAGKPEQ